MVKVHRQLIVLTELLFFASAACFSYHPARMGNFMSTRAGRFSNQACTQFIQDVVSHNCVVIFSKTTCPYCKMAKNVFNQIGATYKVPRVFINGQCIGGGSDTRQLHEQGKLLPLIEKCNPCCLNNAAEGSGSGQYVS
ncbi:glutaredoxin 2 isoform X5 [Pangasianodon hypophthalmus]|uniref:glutaredoxin 2 isoform X5 n=1 Tax=Pangasianodon hypophthalmus TaxID=310915 RepID=UPI000EFFDEB2|nr:glutaredoxin 2 isoform X5 [Pangasianodon hypophthalmus]